jgi:hypothetical protein
MLSPFIDIGIRVFFFLLLAAAALHKLRTPAEFTGTVHAYFRILPGAGSNTVLFASGGIIALEIGAAAAALWAPGPLAALSITSLLMLYAGAMGLNLLAGNRQLDCGCSWSSMPVNWLLLVRNGGLAVVACLLLFAPSERVADVFGVMNGITFSFAALGGYALLEQLLHNQSLQERGAL